MTHAHPGPSVLMGTAALCDKDSRAKEPTYLTPLHWKAVSLESLKGLPPAKGSGGVDFRREGWAPLGRVHHKPTPSGNPPTREPWTFQGAPETSSLAGALSAQHRAAVPVAHHPPATTAGVSELGERPESAYYRFCRPAAAPQGCCCNARAAADNVQANGRGWAPINLQ